MTAVFGPEQSNQFNDGSTGPQITNGDGGVVLPGGERSSAANPLGENYYNKTTGGTPILPSGPKPPIKGDNNRTSGPPGGDIPTLPPGGPSIPPGERTGYPTPGGKKYPYDPYYNYKEPRTWITGDPKTPPPQVDPPNVSVPPNPCLDLRQYGHVLWDYGFQWQSEILNFAASPDVTRIAAFDDMSFTTLTGVRNNEMSYSGRRFRMNCTGYYIRDFLCDVASVSYSTLSSYNVAFAKFNIPKLGGEFYITTNGKLCTLDVVPETEGKTPNLGDDSRVIPPYQPPTAPGDPLGSGQVYAPVYSDDIINESINLCTKELWSRETSSLQYHFRDVTSSLNVCDFVVDVYDGPLTDVCSTVQYRILYGDYDGKGAIDLGGRDNETLTKAIYSQYANVLLPHGETKFTISGSEQDYVYIIDVKRERYGTAMDTGNWELNLGRISSSITTGNSVSSSISFTSWASSGSYIDSSVTSSRIETNLTNKVYDVMQGTIELGVINSGSIIGNFYPNHGIIVLSGAKMDSLFNFNTNRNVQVHGLNPLRLFTSISGSSAPGVYSDSSGDPIGFVGRRLSINHNKIIFVRVKNQLFNFSNNPTFVTGSEGMIIEDFQGLEKAYITTVGLYNPAKELLAVAKLPRPYLKSSTEEALFNIKVTQGQCCT